MANQDDHNQKISFATWYTNKFGGINTFILLIMWLYGGFIWIPAMYLYTGKKRGGLDESSRNKCIIAIGLSVLAVLAGGYSSHIEKVEAEKKQIAAQVAAKEQAEKQRIIAKEQAEKKAELEKQIAQEFAENRENIISNAQQLLDQNKYSDVVAISSKYAFLHDQDLDEIGQVANSALKEKRRIEKIKQACKDIALTPPRTPADTGDEICMWIFNVCLAEPSFIPKEDIIKKNVSLMKELEDNSSDEFKKLNLQLPPLELACLNRAYNQVRKRK